LSIGRRHRRPDRYEPRIRTNFHIRVPEVRVIDSEGRQLGVMSTRDAIKRAQDEGFDLVEVAPQEVPPVCRITDFGKFLYTEKKKKKDSKKKQTRVDIKECKFRPKIGDHDFKVRIRRAVRFLAQGNKVKLTVMFRGREHAHPEVAERLILRAFEEIKDLGKLEAHPKKEGRDMHTLVAPLPEAIRKKAVKAREAKGEILGPKDTAKKEHLREDEVIKEIEIKDTDTAVVETEEAAEGLVETTDSESKRSSPDEDEEEEDDEEEDDDDDDDEKKEEDEEKEEEFEDEDTFEDSDLPNDGFGLSPRREK